MPLDRFLILRKTVYAESDWIIDALSRGGERLTLKAKNAANSKRRFPGGVLEPLNYVEIQFRQARAGVGHLYIEEAKCVDAFPGLREDYRRLEVAFLLLKFIGRLAQEGMTGNTELFDLLGNALKSLQVSEKPSLLLLHFKIKCLFLSGVLPVDRETQEFVSMGIRHHESIRLTDDEYAHLSSSIEQRVREFLQTQVDGSSPSFS